MGDSNRDIFLNDEVFISENKVKYNLSNIQRELDKKIGVYFPIHEENERIVALFCIGRKPF